MKVSLTSALRQALAMVVLSLGIATGMNALAQTPAAAPAAEASAPAAAPAANPAAAASIASSAEEPAANPYGLSALWKEGDMVAKSTLVILVIMSLGSWVVIFSKLIEQNRLGGQAKEAGDNFWKAASVEQGTSTLAEASAFRYIANEGLEATRKHTGLLGHIDFNTWLSMGIDSSVSVVQGNLQKGLAVLATVGSTAPFVGLFGTVWGIYNALVKIGVSGQASIDKVAGPVGEALIMTAIGLAVAVPAVLGYNWLVRRNKVVTDQVRKFARDLHAVMLGEHARKAGKA